MRMLFFYLLTFLTTPIIIIVRTIAEAAPFEMVETVRCQAAFEIAPKLAPTERRLPNLWAKVVASSQQ